VEIEDMELENGILYYPCPCGDRFQIAVEQLSNGEKIATCPSCSLKIEVIFDREDLSDTLVEMGGEPLVSVA
jgi:diphthamide biosynthesis protein 3